MSEEMKKSKITINGQPLEITAKRLTFFDIQEVAPLFIGGDLNFSRYWRHAFSRWLIFQDPDGKSIELDTENLSPEEGAELTTLLPDPAQIMDWLVFREAKLTTSSSLSTASLSTSDFATNEKGWSTF